MLYTPGVAIDASLTYSRDFLCLDYPASWSVRQNRLIGLTDFCPSSDLSGAYPAGIALMTLPETGMDHEALLRTGMFFLVRDLDAPTVDRLGERRVGHLDWYHLVVQGRALVSPGGRNCLHVTKRVALSRPGPGVVTLALYGPTEMTELLVPAFEQLLQSVRIVR
jgi:hypothetical protein